MRRYLLAWFITMAASAIYAAVLPIALSAQERPVFASREGWFTREKPIHFLVSAGLVVAGDGAVRLAGGSRTAATAAGLTLSAGVGLYKEWRDYDRGGWADPKDLMWDGAGIAVGYALTRLITDRLLKAAHRPAPAPAPTLQVEAQAGRL